MHILPWNPWKYIGNKKNLDTFRMIDWAAIFFRIIKSEARQKMNTIQVLLAIRQYILFLFLIQKYPDIRMVPNQQIDVVLHAHMANLQQFEQDCLYLFNTCLQHIPDFGVMGEAERLEWQLAFAQTQELFELNYGQNTMGNSPAACCEILLGCT
ncbi:hypothetical protein [Nostoc sp. CCY0012]|uniref:hypothetical protein n=1 Tax=Nostoc sp. CCY0012 TaxID=1056123 RepID=UPI0039C5DC4B